MAKEQASQQRSVKSNFDRFVRPMGITFGLFLLCAASYYVWIEYLKREEIIPRVGPQAATTHVSLAEVGDMTTYSLDPRYPSKTLSFEGDFNGHIVLLNFWASWCEPCIVETPDLLELAAKNPQLKIVFVNEDSLQEDLDSFLRSFPGMVGERTFVVRDPERELMKKMEVSLLPESHFFDREGRFIRVIKGGINWKTFNLNEQLSDSAL